MTKPTEKFTNYDLGTIVIWTNYQPDPKKPDYCPYNCLERRKRTFADLKVHPRDKA